MELISLCVIQVKPVLYHLYKSNSVICIISSLCCLCSGQRCNSLNPLTYCSTLCKLKPNCISADGEVTPLFSSTSVSFCLSCIFFCLSVSLSVVFKWLHWEFLTNTVFEFQFSIRKNIRQLHLCTRCFSVQGSPGFEPKQSRPRITIRQRCPLSHSDLKEKLLLVFFFS